MKQLVRIWILVAAMITCGALPPQVMGDSMVTTQWSAQAKSKKKSKKKKKARKAKKSAKGAKARKSRPAVASSLASVPTVGKTPQGGAQSGASAWLAVGIPRGVDNQVINYQAIRVNFNPSLRIPNCVAYELTATMVDMSDAPGHEIRKNFKYAHDPAVESCPQGWEYRGTGYSRGHMAPAMDMRWNRTTMAQCFYMTNMCPQDTKLNNDHWRVLEEKVHRWAKRDKRLMVYTGPIMGKNPRMIGKQQQNIAVPDAFFKVVFAPDQKRAIAFIYDNKPCPGNISKYAVTVAEVERRTGLTFSSAMPKHQCRIEDWQ